MFVSIRGRSCGVASIMLLSHCGEYLANVKHLYSRHIRKVMIRLPRRITEKRRPFKWLRMLPNFLRIPANFLRSLRSVCRISCESFANVKTTYECLTITTNALPSIYIIIRHCPGVGAFPRPFCVPNSVALASLTLQVGDWAIH